jgi:hypothetical protein
VKLNRRFQIRAGEFDYQHVTHSFSNNDYQNNFRFSVGLVALFGDR